MPRERRSLPNRGRQGRAPPYQVLAIVQCLKMLRQQLIRSLRRPAHRAALNGYRAFTASAARPAEVDLTIGLCHSHYERRRVLTGLTDGKKVSIEGTTAAPNVVHTLLTPSNSRCGLDPGVRKGRSYHSAILLSREAHDRWELPYVLG